MPPGFWLGLLDRNQRDRWERYLGFIAIAERSSGILRTVY